jgi:hypothetical protein
MIKAIGLALWCMIVLSVTAVGAIESGVVARYLQPAQKVTERFETVVTPPISVPLMEGGSVAGYVIAKFAVTVRLEQPGPVSGRLQDLIADEAFKVIFDLSAERVRQARRAELGAISKAIQDGVNTRESAKRISEVLIKEWTYLKKEDARK